MTVPHVFTAGTTARASEVNENNNYLEALVGGGGGTLAPSELRITGGTPDPWLLPTSPTAVPGLSFTTTASPGNYIVLVSVDFEMPTSTYNTDFAQAQLQLGGVQMYGGITLTSAGAWRGIQSAHWHLAGVAAGTVIRVVGVRSNAANSGIRAAGTGLHVVQYS